MAVSLLILIIRPFAARSKGKNALVILAAPRTFIDNIFSNWLGSPSTKGK